MPSSEQISGIVMLGFAGIIFHSQLMMVIGQSRIEKDVESVSILWLALFELGISSAEIHLTYIWTATVGVWFGAGKTLCHCGGAG